MPHDDCHLTIMDLFNMFKYSHIDLRSEKEYDKGTIPNSVNIPILQNQEFERVGKEYKLHGQDAAIDLGLRLVSGNIKESRIIDWENHINLNQGCSIFCYRGGLRSKLAQEWLLEKKIIVDRISGGYKKVRNKILEQYSENGYDDKQWYILGGLTGSGKTVLLNKFQQAIDIEAIANHRGSAFGNTNTEQPSCANFENTLAFYYLNSKCSNILLEDESKTIGRATLPKTWYDKMQTSDLIVMDINMEERIHNIVNEYITLALDQITKPSLLRDHYLRALQRIQRRLGDVLYKKIRALVEDAFVENSIEKHEDWIHNLLNYYYDPMYNHKLDLRKEYIVHRGNYESCFDYIGSIK